eukprot:TRINITY_DN14083_c0_g1_i1.p1 TRINITY_DN14083_c0_g1~~TRINITY_DN14083_c0_g1_i1.p1  ORF type:complete len:595 (+),score=123.39 TRINITY_DN14083_c0_g1_i1:152-1936(+)
MLSRLFRTTCTRAVFRSSTSVPYHETVPQIPTTDVAQKSEMVRDMGASLLHDPLYNKSTAFPKAERDRLGIRGLIPPKPVNLEQQAERVMLKYRRETDDLRRYDYLSSLQDRNETLFYKILTDNIEELAPIIYTPTVGLACKNLGLLFRRARGMYFAEQDKGEMRAMVYNWPEDEVDVVVVTDGSRILGLGDLGTNGMGIPIGKLSLYVAAGGIHPRKTMPVMIDVGTDNMTLRNDPLYLGINQPRLKGPTYFHLIGEFMDAIHERWPNALVQFEDFNSDNAHPIIHKYRHDHLCFNDDIQGTGAVTLAGVLGALRAQGLQPSAIADQRVVCVGSGSAGLGVCFGLQQAMRRAGLSEAEANSRFFIVDRDGLISQNRPNLTYGQKNFARRDMAEGVSLMNVVQKVKPTVLLGLSAVGGLFTEDLIREVAKNTERPIVFPLSNPTAHAECTAQQAFEWTNGRAFFASGSPFAPVTLNGKKFFPNQCNNMFIFPGIGLASVACKPRVITPEMLTVAAEALASFVSEEELQGGRIYPRIRDIRSVTKIIACAVVKETIQAGLNKQALPVNRTIQEHVEDCMWQPRYNPIIYHPHLRV